MTSPTFDPLEGGRHEPFVSVVTPVRNGAKYIRQCIESVTGQTYSNWEYVIVDNHSTDGTGDIAAEYAERDPRIRVTSPPEPAPMLRNWNHAMRQISRESRYCKVVHADDALYPECLAKMVALAECHPSVGIVASFRDRGDRIEPSAGRMGFTESVLDGRSVGRSYLLRGEYLFGSPTTTLLRSDLVRGKDPFYNEANLHADTEVCVELLLSADFGFVHEVLSFSRRHPDSATQTVKSRITTAVHRYHMFEKYGPRYFHGHEEAVVRFGRRNHYVHFWKNILLHGPRVLNAHRRALGDLGYRLGYGELIRALPSVLLPRRLPVDLAPLRGVRPSRRGAPADPRAEQVV